MRPDPNDVDLSLDESALIAGGEHAELRGAFASFAADADQLYAGWRDTFDI